MKQVIWCVSSSHLQHLIRCNGWHNYIHNLYNEADFDSVQYAFLNFIITSFTRVCQSLVFLCQTPVIWWQPRWNIYELFSNSKCLVDAWVSPKVEWLLWIRQRWINSFLLLNINIGDRNQGDELQELCWWIHTLNWLQQNECSRLWLKYCIQSLLRWIIPYNREVLKRSDRSEFWQPPRQHCQIQIDRII